MNEKKINFGIVFLFFFFLFLFFVQIQNHWNDNKTYVGKLGAAVDHVTQYAARVASELKTRRDFGENCDLYCYIYQSTLTQFCSLTFCCTSLSLLVRAFAAPIGSGCTRARE